MVCCNDFGRRGVPALLVHQDAVIKSAEQAVALQPVLPQLSGQLPLALYLVAQAAINNAVTSSCRCIHLSTQSSLLLMDNSMDNMFDDVMDNVMDNVDDDDCLHRNFELPKLTFAAVCTCSRHCRLSTIWQVVVNADVRICQSELSKLILVKRGVPLLFSGTLSCWAR